jgi:O-antigen/teichoic acid export membrane protein
MSLSRYARSATLAGLYSQAASVLSAAALVPLVFKTLGAAQAGTWFALQAAAIALLLVDFGFSQVISRQAAHSFHYVGGKRHRSLLFLALGTSWRSLRRLEAISNHLLLKLLIGSAAITLVAGMAVATRDAALGLVVAMLSIASACIVYSRIKLAPIEGTGQMHLSRFIVGTFQIFLFVGSAAALALDLGAKGLAAVALLVALAQALTSWAVHRQLISRQAGGGHDPFTGYISPSTWKLAVVAVPFGIMNVGAFLTGVGQIPVVALALGPTVVPSVVMAIKVSQSFNTAFLHYVTAQAPPFTSMIARKDLRGARMLMKRTLLIGGALVLVLTLLQLYVIPPLVEHWLGPDAYLSGMPLLVFCVNYLVTGVVGLMAQFVLAEGRNPFAYSSVLHGVIAVALIPILCPVMGVVGYPIAALIGLTLTSLWVNPYHAWKTWQRLGDDQGLSH